MSSKYGGGRSPFYMSNTEPVAFLHRLHPARLNPDNGADDLYTTDIDLIHYCHKAEDGGATPYPVMLCDAKNANARSYEMSAVQKVVADALFVPAYSVVNSIPDRLERNPMNAAWRQKWIKDVETYNKNLVMAPMNKLAIRLGELCGEELGVESELHAKDVEVSGKKERREVYGWSLSIKEYFAFERILHRRRNVYEVSPGKPHSELDVWDLT